MKKKKGFSFSVVFKFIVSVWMGVLSFFYELFGGKKKDLKNVRRVYFGIAVRMIFLIGVIIFFILLVTGGVFFMMYRNALFTEKNNKAGILAKILSEQAEGYLNTDIYTSKTERRQNFHYISDNSLSFKKFNNDIVKIVLVNDKGIIQYSTYRPDIGVKTNGSYLWKCLEEKELIRYDFSHNDDNFRAVTYPVLLNGGFISTLLENFDQEYKEYRKSKLQGKKSIYKTFYNNYKSNLSDNYTKYYHEKEDLDYLLLDLFIVILKERIKIARKGEGYLWSMGWLNTEKNKIVEAYRNNLPNDALKSIELIEERLFYMKSQVESFQLLGALAILFDLNMIKDEINNNIRRFVIISLIIAFISLIIFSFVIMHLVKNLKILQEGALEFGRGNFAEVISIGTNDETGRLADILNNMARDIKEKNLMEKFISKSAQSMIKKSSSRGMDIKPGIVKRINLSFIFADVRGFTAFSENHTPEEVVKTLNMYFDIQHKVVKKFKGDIDDYVGDQIMAHFAGTTHKERACKASLMIRDEVDKFNKKRAKEGLETFEIGIGVHSGDVVVGNIGAHLRMDFACVGDAVNTTSRLCGKADAGEILVSDEHLKGRKTKFKVSQSFEIEAKGKKDKIKVYKLLGE